MHRVFKLSLLSYPLKRVSIELAGAFGFPFSLRGLIIELKQFIIDHNP
jgi:hypothetical protein